MNQQERAMVIWSVFFVVSGIVFMFAFYYSPVVGVLVTFAYIVLYMGLCSMFVLVFREMESIKEDTILMLSERKDELEEIKKAIHAKYYSKRIDETSFRNMIEEYEKKLTEIEVRMQRLQKKSVKKRA